MTRLVAAGLLVASLGGCAAVPAAAWVGLAGAGLGYAASVNSLGVELLKRQPAPSPESDHPAIEEMPTPP